jgi:amino acid transporter
MSEPGVEKVSQQPTEKAFDGDSSDKHDHGHGEVTFIGDHGAESELQRKLSTRHITMIALGSSIGMGLWLGSGSSLASGGPAAMFLGYLLSGTMIWTVSQSIGEMAVM